MTKRVHTVRNTNKNDINITIHNKIGVKKRKRRNRKGKKNVKTELGNPVQPLSQPIVFNTGSAMPSLNNLALQQEPDYKTYSKNYLFDNDVATTLSNKEKNKKNDNEIDLQSDDDITTKQPKKPKPESTYETLMKKKKSVLEETLKELYPYLKVAGGMSKPKMVSRILEFQRDFNFNSKPPANIEPMTHFENQASFSEPIDTSIKSQDAATLENSILSQPPTRIPEKFTVRLPRSHPSAQTQEGKSSPRNTHNTSPRWRN